MTQRWYWEKVDTKSSASSGDLAKLFKNEGVESPGALREGSPSDDATLLAREVIQNSWDAARELQDEFEAENAIAPDFDITFAFRQHTEGKHRFVHQLGLDELADRAAASDRRRLGLADDDCLSRITGDDPLPVLEIREDGTTGMYGPFVGTRSKMYLALVSLGITLKDDGAGGSYGYGKGGLIRGSRTRTVLAYSCFRERPDDPGVTRRLLGMTYWGLHDIDGESFNGFGRFGNEVAVGDVQPFENEAADEVAAALGLAVRDASRGSELGTTFVLIDPAVTPDGLRAAVERSWWPAIEQRLFEVTIEDVDGTLHVPRPRKDPVLASFIRAAEVATVSQDSVLEGEKSQRLQRLASSELSQDYAAGSLGLVADLDGWSYPASADEDEVQHRSLVALVRGPRMVVQYHDAGRARPYVRGVFIAHDDIDDLLRQTEPKAHDCWSTSVTVDGIDPDAPVVAELVLTRLRKAVDTFRSSLKPPVPDRRAIRLPELEHLLGPLLTGEGSDAAPPPPAPPREVSIHIPEQRLEPAGPDAIRLRATVAFSLSGQVEGIEEADARVRIAFKILEDDRAAKETHPVEFLSVPAGFGYADDAEGEFEGRLGRSMSRFELVTAPYQPDWSGRLIVEGDLLKEAVADE